MDIPAGYAWKYAQNTKTLERESSLVRAKDMAHLSNDLTDYQQSTAILLS